MHANDEKFQYPEGLTLRAVADQIEIELFNPDAIAKHTITLLSPK